MLAQLLRTSPGPISAVALISGFLMIASGLLPLGIVGAVLIMFAFLVPFLRLGVTTRPRALNAPLVRGDEPQATTPSLREPTSGKADAVDDYLNAFAAAREHRTIADIVRAERALDVLRHTQRRQRDTPADSVAIAHAAIDVHADSHADLTSDVLDQLGVELTDLKADIWAESMRAHRPKSDPVTIDG